MKFFVTIFTVLLISGCTALLNISGPSSLANCLHPELSEELDNQCELEPWVDYWMQVNTLNWNERQKLLKKLTSKEVDQVKQVLISHVPNTPYQSRLRAQLIAQQLIKDNKGKLAKFIQLIVYLPAQEKLELESALTTQTQFNIRQEQKIQTQDETISKQEQQINKLLQIERNIIDKPKETTP